MNVASLNLNPIVLRTEANFGVPTQPMSNFKQLNLCSYHTEYERQSASHMEYRMTFEAAKNSSLRNKEVCRLNGHQRRMSLVALWLLLLHVVQPEAPCLGSKFHVLFHLLFPIQWP